MANRLSDDDYYTLDRFVRAVLQRHCSGKVDEDLSVLAIMDPLTALLDGQGVDDHAFLPAIRHQLAKWSSN